MNDFWIVARTGRIFVRDAMSIVPVDEVDDDDDDVSSRTNDVESSGNPSSSSSCS